MCSKGLVVKWWNLPSKNEIIKTNSGIVLLIEERSLHKVKIAKILSHVRTVNLHINVIKVGNAFFYKM